MATAQNGEFLSIIGSISKFAGALVGTAVITGKRIIGEAKPPSKGSSDKPKEKNIPAQTKRKKKVVSKTETKVPKTKKKKAVKRKPAGSSGKSGTSKKKPSGSPAKKKKITTRKKKTTRRKTKKIAKNEVSSPSQNGLTSETSAGTNTPTKKQKPRVQHPIAKAKIADKKSSRANKAVVPTASVL